MKRLINLLLALSLTALLAGCGDDDPDPIDPVYDTFTSTNVKQGAVYFNFDHEMETPQPDITFKLVNRSPEFYLNRDIFGNGHRNGPVLIYDSQMTDMAAVTRAPNNEAMFTQDADTTITGDGWYNYDFVNHVIVSKNKVYIVKTARDNYVKFKVDSYGGGAFTVTYCLAETDTTFAPALTDTVRVVSNPATDLNGERGFSFAHGKIAAHEWDIKLSYGSVDEPGAPAGVKFPMILLNRTDGATAKIIASTEKFEDVNAVSATGLTTDSNSAYVIGTRCLAYDETTHRLNPTEETIVIETTGGKRVKLKMLNYYNDSGASGYMKFQYEKAN